MQGNGEDLALTSPINAYVKLSSLTEGVPTRYKRPRKRKKPTIMITAVEIARDQLVRANKKEVIKAP